MPSVTKGKPVRIAEALDRAKNALALLHHMLGDSFPKGVADMTRYRRLLAFARAGKARGRPWQQVRFVLSVAELEAWDATAFAFLRDTPDEDLVDDLDTVLALLAQLEGRLSALSLRVTGALFRFQEAEKPGAVARLRGLAELAMNEEAHLRARRVDFLLLGQVNPAGRASVPLGTRVGLAPRESRLQREELEVRMAELDFSQSEIGIMSDGPGGSARDRGKKVAQRHARKEKKQPR